MLLMPMLYLPPLSYMALLAGEKEIHMEAQENYIKSSYRNRCEIIGANGPIDLSIPIDGGRDHHQAYRDTRMAYTTDWQHRHLMSIISCYGSTPFFEHYMPYLEPFYTRKYERLFDFNRDLLTLIIRLMKLDVSIHYTDVYEKEPAMTDLRNAFKPNKLLHVINIDQGIFSLMQASYMSAFDGVERSMQTSCIDLLFNEGPQSKAILKEMIIHNLF